MTRFFKLAVMAIVVLSLGSTAKAQNYYWNQDAAGTWDTSALNWRLSNTGPLVAFPGTTNTAVFGGFITANRAIAVGAGGITAGGITFENVGNQIYTVGTSSNNILLNSGSETDFIRVNAGTVGLQVIQNSNISFTNNLSIVNNGAFGATTLSITSAIARAAAGGSITFDGQSTTSLTGAIGNSVTGGVTKNGTGTVILGSAANAFTGGITINAGVLGINSNDTMLGDATNVVNINAGGTFRFNSTLGAATPRRFNINGNAANPSGIDLGSAVTAILSGNSATTGLVGSGVGYVTTSIPSSLTAPTSGILSIEGAQTGFTGSLVVGGMNLVGAAPQGKFAITSGTSNGATLRLQNAGTLPNATGLTFNNSSLLTIIQPTTAVTGRLGTAPITLNSGRFNYNPSANGGTAITETFGTLTISGGVVFSASTTAGPATGTTLSFGTFTRNDNATVIFRNAAVGTSGAFGGPAATTSQKLFFGGLSQDITSSGPTRSVVPWAGNISTSTGTEASGLMTYDDNGFRTLNTTTEYFAASAANLLATAGAGTNVRVTASPQTVAVGGQTINALSINATSTFTATTQATDILTITSGAVAMFNTTTINNVTFNFPNGAFFHHGFPVTLTGTALFSGSGGLTNTAYSASTSYRITFNNTVANTFTGGLFINGNAQIVFQANNHLGNDGGGNAAGNITLGGGQLIYTPAAAATISLNDGANNRAIRVGASNGTIGTSVALANLQIPGVISGPGELQFGGGLSSSATGIVELLNNSNTYTGGTRISTGILRAGAEGSFGTGYILLNGGTLQNAGSFSITRPVSVVASSTIDTNTFNMTLTGGLNGSSGNSGFTPTTMTVTKNGVGALNINGSSSFAGALTISSQTAGTSTINISGNGTAPELGTVTVGANGVFGVSDIGTANPNRVGRATNVILNNNGTVGAPDPIFNITTNASGGTALSFGTLTVTGGTLAEPNAATVNIVDGGTGSNTLTFLSLASLTTNNTVSILGTTNLGTAGGTRIYFQTAPILTGGIITGVTFTGAGGTGTATYEPILGLQLFVTSTGTFIDNFNNVGAGSPTSTIANYTTAGITTANLGAAINTLTMAHDVNLVTGLYGATTTGGVNGLGNENAPNNVFIIKSGITVNTANSAINSTNPSEIRFGSATPSLVASITTNFDLTTGVNVTLATTGGLLKQGTAAWNINGTNNITGLYTVNAGTLNLNTNATASALAGSAGTIAIAATRTLTLNGTDGSTQTFAGLLSGSGALTTAAGYTGVTVLSGNSTGYTGAVTINGGTIAPGNAGAFGPATNPTITVGSGGTLAFQGGITFNAIPVSISGVGAAGRSGAIDNISGTNIYNGAITITGATTIGATSGQITLGGGITSTTNPVTFNTASTSTIVLNTVAMNLGTQPLTKVGSGTLVLPNFANTFGTININGGLVQASADNNFGATSNAINLDSGGIQYGAVFTLDPARSVVITASGGTIDTQANNVSYAVPTSGASATSVLLKRGTGTLTLDVTPTNAGGLTIQQGIITLGAASTLNATAQLTVGNTQADNTAQLNLNGRNASTTSLTFYAKNSGGATSQITGTGTLTVNGNISYLDNIGTPGNSFSVNVANTVTAINLSGATRNFTIAGNNNSGGDLFFNAPITNGGVNYTGSPSVNNSSAAVLVFAAANTYTGPTIINRGVLLTTVANSIPAASSLTLAAISGNTAQLSINNLATTVASLSATTAGSNLIVTGGTTGILTVNQSTNTTFNGVISGTGGLTKSGTGTLTLSGVNSYTGATTVNGGTLAVGTGGTGSLAGTAVTVNTGAALGGSGTINGAVTFAAGSIIAPGNSVGTLTVANNVTINGGSGTAWNIEFNGIPTNTLATADQTNVDRLVITGATNNLTFATTTTNTVAINLTLAGGSMDLYQPVFYRIATTNAASNIVGFDATHFVINPVNFVIQGAPVIQTDGNNVVINFVPVPEPATILGLSSLALSGFALIRRRMKKTTVVNETLAV